MVEVVMRKINEIRPDPNNPRKTWDEDKLKESSESYKHQGVMVPIEIDTKNVIICGELRWRAAKLAGLTTIPCMIREGLTPEQRTERQLVENIDRQDVQPEELADAFEKLLKVAAATLEKGSNRDEGITKLAKRLGVKRDWINEMLCFKRNASKELKAAVLADEIGTRTATRIAENLPGEPELQNKLLEEWKTEDYGRDEMIQIAQTLGKEKVPEFIKEAIVSNKVSLDDAVNEIRSAGEKGVLREADPKKQFRNDLRFTRRYYRDLGMRIMAWKANQYYKMLEREEAMKELVLTNNTIKILEGHAERLEEIK